MNNYVRRRETSIWEQDWYCELGGEYQHFWDFINDNCDNAGIWIPNKKGFEMRTGFRVNLDSFFKKVNGDKKRIIVTDNGGWFLPGFIQEQWFSKQNSFDLVLNNNFHLSLLKILKSFNINELSVRGLRGVSQGSGKGSERGLYSNNNKNINTIEEDINHKEEEKKEEKRISVKPLGMEIVRATATEAWSDKAWVEQLAMGVRLSIGDIKLWMSQFNASICNDYIQDFNERVYKKMFVGWLSMKQSKGRKLIVPEVNNQKIELKKLEI